MKRSMRFGLSTFLAVVLVLGSGLGLSVRYYLSQPDHFVQKTRSVEGYRVSGCWQVDRRGNDHLVWLVVFAKGNLAISGGGDGVTSAAFVRDFEKPDTDDGVGLWNRGIFQAGKMFKGSDEGRLWLYRSTKLTVAEVTSDQFARLDASFKNFQNLETSSLWKNVLRPPAERESDAFQEAMKDPNSPVLNGKPTSE